MRIFGFIIGRFRARKRRRRTINDRLEEIATRALLDAAGRDFRVMASMINKYCHVRVYHDREEENIRENIRAKIYKKAEQTILESRSRELDRRINGIIDTILRGCSEGGGRQYEEGAGVAFRAGERKGPPKVYGRYRRMIAGETTTGEKHSLSEHSLTAEKHEGTSS